MLRVLFASALYLALAGQCNAFSTNMASPLLRTGGRASVCPMNLQMSEGRPLQRSEVLGVAGAMAAGMFLAPAEALAARKPGSDGTWAKHIGMEQNNSLVCV